MSLSCKATFCNNAKHVPVQKLWNNSYYGLNSRESSRFIHLLNTIGVKGWYRLILQTFASHLYIISIYGIVKTTFWVNSIYGIRVVGYRTRLWCHRLSSRKMWHTPHLPWFELNSKHGLQVKTTFWVNSIYGIRVVGYRTRLWCHRLSSRKMWHTPHLPWFELKVIPW